MHHFNKTQQILASAREKIDIHLNSPFPYITSKRLPTQKNSMSFALFFNHPNRIHVTFHSAYNDKTFDSGSDEPNF